MFDVQKAVWRMAKHVFGTISLLLSDRNSDQLLQLHVSHHACHEGCCYTYELLCWYTYESHDYLKATIQQN